jgi:hypothetical protein
MDKIEPEAMMNTTGRTSGELQEEGKAMDADLTNANPTHLMGSHDESRQEQCVY